MESGGERNRGLYVLKSRGMPHSNQIREFSLTGHGVELREPYIGPAGVLTGSARLAQEAVERATQVRSEQGIQRDQDQLNSRRVAHEAQIVALRAEFAAQEAIATRLIDQARASDDVLAHDRHDMAVSRMGKTQ
jgi:circadian clock protein KaiC